MKDVVILDKGLSISHLKKSGSNRVKREEGICFSIHNQMGSLFHTTTFYNSYMFKERNIIT